MHRPAPCQCPPRWHRRGQIGKRRLGGGGPLGDSEETDVVSVHLSAMVEVGDDGGLGVGRPIETPSLGPGLDIGQA